MFLLRQFLKQEPPVQKQKVEPLSDDDNDVEVGQFDWLVTIAEVTTQRLFASQIMPISDEIITAYPQGDDIEYNTSESDDEEKLKRFR